MKHCRSVHLIIVVLVIKLKFSNALVSPRIKTNNNKYNVLSARKVWIEEAEEGFIDDDENLMTGEICVRSMKAFVTFDDNQNKKSLLCAGALIKRPLSNIYDCWMADSLFDETNIQLQGAKMILDDLFYFHLNRSNSNTLEEMTSNFIVQSGYAESDFHSASYMSAIQRGFKPIKEITMYGQIPIASHLKHLDVDNEDSDALIFDIFDGIERYTMHQSKSIKAREISDIIERMKMKTKPQWQFE